MYKTNMISDCCGKEIQRSYLLGTVYYTCSGCGNRFTVAKTKFMADICRDCGGLSADDSCQCPKEKGGE